MGIPSTAPLTRPNIQYNPTTTPGFGLLGHGVAEVRVNHVWVEVASVPLVQKRSVAPPTHVFFFFFPFAMDLSPGEYDRAGENRSPLLADFRRLAESKISTVLV